MSSSGAGRWGGDFPWDDPPGTGWAVQSALEDTEAALRRSAARLRACGQEDRARRAERSAARVRFDLDEPRVARQLYAAAARLRDIQGIKQLADQVLETVRRSRKLTAATCSWRTRPPNARPLRALAPKRRSAACGPSSLSPGR